MSIRTKPRFTLDIITSISRAWPSSRSDKTQTPVGVVPYISHIGMCRPKGYGFCAVSAHFGLESGIVFEELQECMNVFIVLILNE